MPFMWFCAFDIPLGWESNFLIGIVHNNYLGNSIKRPLRRSILSWIKMTRVTGVPRHLLQMKLLTATKIVLYKQK